MKIQTISLSNKGNVRENNEDAVAICPDLTLQEWSDNEVYEPLGPLGAVAIVADGMGGGKAGEVASNLAIQRLKKSFAEDIPSIEAPDSVKNAFVEDAFAKANIDIVNYTNIEPDTIGLGTTLVVLWLEERIAHVSWCGDSRCYVFNYDKGLIRLTKDHSYVQELVDSGELSPDKMNDHPDSHLITRGLGDIDVMSTAETCTIKAMEGDIFLLCSDGLCGYCDDSTIERIFYKYLNDIHTCGHKLIEVALQSGGYDNVTVALVGTLPDSCEKRNPSLLKQLRRIWRNP